MTLGVGPADGVREGEGVGVGTVAVTVGVGGTAEVLGDAVPVGVVAGSDGVVVGGLGVGVGVAGADAVALEEEVGTAIVVVDGVGAAEVAGFSKESRGRRATRVVLPGSGGPATSLASTVGSCSGGGMMNRAVHGLCTPAGLIAATWTSTRSAEAGQARVIDSRRTVPTRRPSRRTSNMTWPASGAGVQAMVKVLASLLARRRSWTGAGTDLGPVGSTADGVVVDGTTEVGEGVGPVTSSWGLERSRAATVTAPIAATATAMTTSGRGRTGQA